MKKYLKTALSVLLAAALCGCSEIADINISGEESSSSSSDEESSSSSSVVYNDSEPQEYEIDKKEFVGKLNAEGGVLKNAAEMNDGDYDGRGYVRFEQGGKLTHIITPDSSQHYRFIIAARSEKGASISLKLKNGTEGVFYVPAAEKDEDGNVSQKFVLSCVDCVYLAEGKNVFALSVDKGSVDIDYIVVESSDRVDKSFYRTGTSAENPYASLGVVGAMKYFSDIYGEYSMTAANVSVGTNAEIDAIFKLTGRYPAIRGSELAYAVLGNVEKDEVLEKDIQLALEWSKNGGIVAYKWHWYSPNRLRSVKTGAFDIKETLKSVNIDEISVMTAGEISYLTTNGYISKDFSALITDIDQLALSLSKLKYKDAVTLFEPIPNADSGLYWWGDDAECYKKLYALIFNRLCKYHKLSNLIFVYNGSNIDYYPGTEYCDIVGQSAFENSTSAFAGRFYAVANALPNKKMLAITACDKLADGDFMNRDNAMWLWCATECGKYVIDEYGVFSSEYNAAAALKKAYNSTVMITRDELPDISKYAIA